MLVLDSPEYYYIQLKNAPPHVECPPENAGVAFLKEEGGWIVEMEETDVVGKIVRPLRLWFNAIHKKVKVVKFASDSTTRSELVVRRVNVLDAGRFEEIIGPEGVTGEYEEGEGARR